MTVTRVDLDRKVAALRARAEEIQTVLDNMQDPDARMKMLRLAEFYEKSCRACRRRSHSRRFNKERPNGHLIL
jgi:hypothetical protein